MAGTIERTLALKLIGDVSGLRKDLKGTQRQFGQLTKSTLSWGKALGGSVLIGGVLGVADALGEAWDGFRSGEKAAAGMRKAWKNLRLDGKAYRKVLDQVTDSTLKLGTSDDEAVEAFTRSLSRTRDYKQSLRELTIAQDLVAQGSATNLENAFRMIQQAGTGSARVVDRFGLTSKTSAGRIAELGRQVAGAARQKAKLEPLQVLFNRMGEDLEGIVGSFAKGDFKGFTKALGGLGETVSDALFGGAGKDGIRNSKSAGLVNQFGKWAQKLADGIAEVDWGKALGDGLNAGLKALTTAGANGTLSTLATIGAAIMAGLFAADLAVTALTTLFSVPKLLVKGVIAAITNVGIAMMGTLFGAQKVTEAAGTALSGTITKAAEGKAVSGAAAGAGLSIGGIIAAGIGALIAGAIIGGLTLATEEKNRLPTALLASAKQARGRGANSASSVRAQLRRSFPGASDRQIQQALWEAGFRAPPGFHSGGGRGRKTGFASGTAGAPPGWHWVGERGPELRRFRGGEQVMSNRQSMAMGGTVVNITVVSPVGSSPVDIGRELKRYLTEYERRGG